MKIAPGKVSASFSSSAPFAPGDLVMYENEGVPVLGAMGVFKKQKYAVLNERGREVEMAANRLYALPGKLPGEAVTAEKKIQYFEQLRRESSLEGEKIDLEELWGVVSAEERAYSAQELCELFFSDNKLLHHLGLRLRLIYDKIFFKRDQNDFIPRPQGIVEELKKAQAARQEKERVQRLTIESFKGRLEHPEQPLPKEAGETLRLLEEMAAGADQDHGRQKEAKELLEACVKELRLELYGSKEAQAFSLLESLRYFEPNENLSLIRHRPPLRFSEEALREAEELRLPASFDELPEDEKKNRVDLTALDAFTIDDSTTKDMDDALSLERLPDGYRLWVHVSDVAGWFPLGGALNQEALHRATSIYLPERTVNMLPEALSQDKFSLVLDQVRPSLSCAFEISSQLKVGPGKIVPSLIKVRRRYSYDQVDELLEGESGDLGVLYNIAVNHEAERLERGAQKIYKHDIAIVLKENGDFELVDVDEHGPSRSLIGEMMVLANSLLAEYAAANQLPVVYRLQEPPEEVDMRNIPLGPAHDYAERARLKKSSTGFSPGLHAGLGLQAYIQATSPIRRYVDICNQRQILSHLESGKPFYSEEQFADILQKLEEPLMSAAAVSKETKRYWLLKYVQRRMSRPSSQGQKPGLIAGVVLRSDLKNPLVELDEAFLPALVKTGQSVRPGDQLLLKISAVDPRMDYLKLEKV
jgi:exoribonuclease II